MQRNLENDPYERKYIFRSNATNWNHGITTQKCMIFGPKGLQIWLVISGSKNYGGELNKFYKIIKCKLK